MKTYSPSRLFNIPFELQVPKSEPQRIKGVTVKEWDSVRMVFGSFVTFGGTEREVNGVQIVEDTATVECFFDPDVKADCRLLNLNTATLYEIIGTPENIEGRNQYLSIKVRALKGGA